MPTVEELRKQLETWEQTERTLLAQASELEHEARYKRRQRDELRGQLAELGKQLASCEQTVAAQTAADAAEASRQLAAEAADQARMAAAQARDALYTVERCEQRLVELLESVPEA